MFIGSLTFATYYSKNSIYMAFVLLFSVEEEE